MGLGDLRQRYNRAQRSANAVLEELDRMRFEAWAEKETAGYYLRPLLAVYFYWDPRIHHQTTQPGTTLAGSLPWRFSPSVDKCIRRTCREHDDLVALLERDEDVARTRSVGLTRQQ